MDNPLISKLSVASDFNANDRARLGRLTEGALRVEGRVDLIEEGDRPEHVHLVMEGLACRYKLVQDGRRQILALLLPGDFCDFQVALLHTMDHSIATLSPCKIVRIARDTVNELIQYYPRITRALWWATLVDEAILRENVAGLGQRETDRQMAHLFCELHARLETVGLVLDDAFDLFLTQEELGDILGVSIVHTNRTLMDLRARNLVDFRKGRVTIIDLDRLTAFAGFRPNYLHLSGIKRETGTRSRPVADIFVGATSQRRRGPSLQPSGALVARANGSVRSVRAMFTLNSMELTKKRVLVVEDEYFAAEEMAAAVRDAGAQVVGPAASIEDALALIRSGQAIDAAILDINLGGDKVFPVANALAEHAIPIVFVTGYDDWMIPAQYDDVPIFRKPTDPAHVVQTLFAS